MSGIIYESALDGQEGGPKAATEGSFAGDIIQFLGDQIIACFPGESALLAASESGGPEPRGRAGSRDNKISIRDEEDPAAPQDEKRKKKSARKKKKKEGRSAERRGEAAQVELQRLS